MQDRNHYSSEEAAVLGQLREQKPSALSERPSLWIWLEEEEGIENASNRNSEIASLHEKLVSEEETLITKESENVCSRLF